MYVDLPRVIFRRSRSKVHWFDAAVSFLARLIFLFFISLLFFLKYVNLSLWHGAQRPPSRPRGEESSMTWSV